MDGASSPLECCKKSNKCQPVTSTNHTFAGQSRIFADVFLLVKEKSHNALFLSFCFKLVTSGNVLQVNLS